MAFEAEFESFGVLCGPNGAGKSSVFDALALVRSLATGDCFLGGEGERDITELELTNWLDSKVQEFELSVRSGGHEFEYLIHIEQAVTHEKPRIVSERATCDGKMLFERDKVGVRLQPTPGKTALRFPLDGRQAALGSIQPKSGRAEIEVLQQAMANLLILRPNPRSFQKESKAEAQHPDISLSNVISWYRHLSLEQEWTDRLRDSLKEVWPDFKSFKLENVGINAKSLQLRFGESLFFHQLSDGEKLLVALYMVRDALATGEVQTVLIDEPDNFVGLPELQPWVLAMRELLDEEHQTILISHHPEILNSAGEDAGRYLWRDNHTSPTRIGPLNVPEGLSAAEAVTRGWIRG